MEKALTQAMKGLEKFGPDGLVFSVIILATFSALIAHVEPAWAIGGGCIFCLLWLLRNFLTARTEFNAKKSNLVQTAETRGAKIASRKPRAKRLPPPASTPPTPELPRP